MSAEPTAVSVSARQRIGWQFALGAWLALISLSLLWELWLAPLRAGGVWWAVKVVPLLLALPGVARARAYTMQWALLLSLAYLLHGLVRTFDPAPARWLAAIEVVLALVFFCGAIVYLRPLKLASRAAKAQPR
jgi:uncharacterized membrane protein